MNIWVSIFIIAMDIISKLIVLWLLLMIWYWCSMVSRGWLVISWSWDIRCWGRCISYWCRSICSWCRCIRCWRSIWITCIGSSH